MDNHGVLTERNATQGLIGMGEIRVNLEATFSEGASRRSKILHSSGRKIGSKLKSVKGELKSLLSPYPRHNCISLWVHRPHVCMSAHASCLFLRNEVQLASYVDLHLFFRSEVMSHAFLHAVNILQRPAFPGLLDRLLSCKFSCLNWTVSAARVIFHHGAVVTVSS